MHKKTTKEETNLHPRNIRSPYGNRASIEIDFKQYAELLSEHDLTDEQATQLLSALWSIAVAFVEFGFGVHPTQLGCGKPEENKNVRPLDSENALHLGLNQHISDRFSDATTKQHSPSESEDA